MKCNYNGEKVSNVFHCQVCGKRFKGKTIFFGETLNLEIWQKTVRVSIHPQISGFWFYMQKDILKINLHKASSCPDARVNRVCV